LKEGAGLEKALNIGGELKNGTKKLMQSSNFSNDTFSVPQVFSNSILVQIIIFIIAQFLV
jgi:hypothetical protein